MSDAPGEGGEETRGAVGRQKLEALLDVQSDKENSELFIDIIWRQTSRMERMVSYLLRMARLDSLL